MDDDFGFDSADEADLLAAVDGVNPAAKRRNEDPSGQQEPTSKRQRASDNTNVAERVLNERFGLKSFRLEQKAAINRLLDGDSAVVVFPTGGGKSLCYQVPAVAIKELDRETGARSPEDGGVSVVISPLIALMKDQVDALRRRGVAAAVLDSTQSREEFVDIHSKLANGKLDLLYCAPERLNNEGFLASLQSIRGGIRLLAIDEAHCISEWGHSFRPDYLKIARFAKEANVERVVCLTATATATVAQDIRATFNVPPEGLFVTSMYRPNLRLMVEAISPDDNQVEICSGFLQGHPGPAIIYVTTHAAAEKLAGDLVKKKFNARPYHAGLDKDIRSDIQDKFLRSDNMIIVGTIAFGMGIDKENVRTIIHFDLPSSIEAYSQQIGRAGRDGKPSTCLLYLSNKDFFLRNIMIHGERPSRLALRALFDEICSADNCEMRPGDTFSVALTSQSKRVDVRETQLSIIYAYLELKFGLLRSSTPQYSEYKYQVLQGQALAADSSPAAKYIQRQSKKAQLWTYIDVDVPPGSGGVDRADITRKLDSWAESGIIKLDKKGVQKVFRITKAFPKSREETDRIIDNIDTEIVKKEKQDLQRVQDLVDLLTGTKCLTRSLAAYFADTTHASAKECGHCTWCETHKQVRLPNFVPQQLDEKLMKGILTICKTACAREAGKADDLAATAAKAKSPDKARTATAQARQALANSTAKEDARFMACVAFGIKTPRIGSMGLHNTKAAFETMSNCNFVELVDAFEEMMK
ncbi:RecQ family ATP-dependent DNA helicase [Colletotrichum higginsianum IMI 349063]|uniref:ATP-dependent DNA helicase n=2 Tax=Colletotrichum higginsianum TaxID=80884 RepID=A0A1B7YH13_COLHI|nr:RecQ family ATP-dependent DNA helicase [Colletotrichum higginsianum IMI 349063]OBR11346.1 RecQ family ATP-dependent DNA helicase [Colletotrichum higginsianum IMI 349063]TIC99962.1 ATP-dependent DNA helicase RecQ [Colletotrichum higginsianum]